MTRLPTPGADTGKWGEILNEFLSQAHTSDGKLKTDSVTAGQLAPGSVVTPALADGSVAQAKLHSAVQATLAKADTAVQPGDFGTAATLDVGHTAGTVAAGDDSRIIGALAASQLDGAASNLVNAPASSLSEALRSTFATGMVHFVVGHTEPESPTTEDGRQIVWIDTTVTVAAAAPTFSDVADTYTIPATTGVTYLIGGNPATAGTYSATPPTTVTVTATAQPGYALTGTTTWSGDFVVNITTPAEAGTLHMHYDAAASGVLTLSGSDVTAWAPSAGSTGSLVAYSAGQPSTSTINALTAVKFVESQSDALRTTSFGTLSATGGATLCAVVAVEDAYGAGSVLTAIGGAVEVNGNGEVMARNSTYTATSPTPLGIGVPRFITWELDGAELSASVDGALTTVGAATPSNLTTNFSIGAAYGGAGTNFSSVTVCEVWAYDTSITDAARAGLLAYAQDKWGVA